MREIILSGSSNLDIGGKLNFPVFGSKILRTKEACFTSLFKHSVHNVLNYFFRLNIPHYIWVEILCYVFEVEGGGRVKRKCHMAVPCDCQFMSGTLKIMRLHS